MAKNVVVKQNAQDKEIPVEVLAEAILAISQNIKALRRGRLTDKALLLLITHAAPQTGTRGSKKSISQREVKAVLAGIDNLEREYLKRG